MTIPGRPDIINIRPTNLYHSVTITYQDGIEKTLSGYRFLGEKTSPGHPHLLWSAGTPKNPHYNDTEYCEDIVLDLILRIQIRVIISKDQDISVYKRSRPHQVTFLDYVTDFSYDVDLKQLTTCKKCDSYNDLIVTGKCCQFKDKRLLSITVEHGVEI